MAFSLLPRRALVLVVLAVAVGAWFALRQVSPTPPPQEGGPPGGFAMPVEGTKAKSGLLIESLQAVGSLVAEDGIMVRPEVAGRVTAILFTEGQKVEKGAALVQLDDSIYKAQLDQAEAQLALAQRTFNRSTALAGRGAGTVQAQDESSSNLKVAAAAVELARAQLDKTKIVAPFAGVVGIRQISIGDYVMPGHDMVTLQALDTMKVDFRVPETALGQLKVGQDVRLTTAAYPGEVFTGKVTAIDPLVDVNGRSVPLRAVVPNTGDKLRPGQFAELELVLREVPDAVFVPPAAIIPMGNESFVFKVVEGQATLTKVIIAQRQSDRVAIGEGLAAGDEVVTGGQTKLMGGPAGAPVPVSVTDPEAPPAAPATATPAEEKN